MALDESWNPLRGLWSASNRLILPEQPDRHASSSASVSFIAKDSMCAIDYTWSYEGDPHQGQLLLSVVSDARAIEAVFWDTWHMGPKFMHMTGAVDDRNVTIVNGVYQVPDSQDWGWRIMIEPTHKDGWLMQMYNVAPDGQLYLGVDSPFVRA
jgi:hypothetical protein